jgi:hypothetical protein
MMRAYAQVEERAHEGDQKEEKGAANARVIILQTLRSSPAMVKQKEPAQVD